MSFLIEISSFISFTETLKIIRSIEDETYKDYLIIY